MRPPPDETVVQRLVREMKASPGKALLLGVGAVVAGFVWGPLVMAGGKSSSPVAASGAAGAVTAAAVDGVVAAPVAARRDPGAIRDEFIRIAEAARGLRRLAEPVGRIEGEHDPFLLEASVATVVAPAPETDEEPEDVVLEERARVAKLALSGVVEFPRGRRAVLDGEVVAVGDEHGGFAVIRIEEREVVVGGRFGTYRVALGGTEDER